MLNITIREMQIKTTVRYHLTLVRMAIIKNLQMINAGEDVEKTVPSYINGGNLNWYNHDGDRYLGSLKKKLKLELPYDPGIPLLGIYPEKIII